MDRKSELYLKQSKKAAEDIATWPKWMQDNLKPTTVVIPDVPEDLTLTGGVSFDDAHAVISKGHPPEAERVALIDFDGTIFPFGYLFDYETEPKPFAVEALQILKSFGYTIIIFTSRVSPTWLSKIGHTKDQHVDYITKRCNDWNIPFDSITSEKTPAEFYIDDKAYRYDNNWNALIETIVGGNNAV